MPWKPLLAATYLVARTQSNMVKHGEAVSRNFFDFFLQKNSNRHTIFLLIVFVAGMDLAIALMEDGEVCTLYTAARYAYTVYGRFVSHYYI